MSNEQFFVSQVKPGMILEYSATVDGLAVKTPGLVLGKSINSNWTVYWIGSWNPFYGRTSEERTSIISFSQPKRWKVVA
jgi:hypothetical protein